MILQEKEPEKIVDTIKSNYIFITKRDYEDVAKEKYWPPAKVIELATGKSWNELLGETKKGYSQKWLAAKVEDFFYENGFVPDSEEAGEYGFDLYEYKKVFGSWVKAINYCGLSPVNCRKASKPPKDGDFIGYYIELSNALGHFAQVKDIENDGLMHFTYFLSHTPFRNLAELRLYILNDKKLSIGESNFCIRSKHTKNWLKKELEEIAKRNEGNLPAGEHLDRILQTKCMSTSKHLSKIFGLKSPGMLYTLLDQRDNIDKSE